MRARLALALVCGVGIFASCAPDPVCPLGFWPSSFGGCVPNEAEDVAVDGVTSDLADAGFSGDVGGQDAADDTDSQLSEPDVSEPDVSEPDVSDVFEPDVSDVFEPDACTPDCSRVECGSDGCGGECGTCAETERCMEGVCSVEEFPPASSCEEAYTCAIACGASEECLARCGLVSAAEDLQADVISALVCGRFECGEDLDVPGWSECATERCAEVRACLGREVEVGECTNPADVLVFERFGDEGVSELNGECSFSCGRADDTTSCIRDCLQERSGLSAGCARCFGESGSCAVSSCAFECLLPGPFCVDCVAENCGEAFEECAGLPQPG